MKLLTLSILVLLAWQCGAAQEIPAGTTLPIMLNSTLDARKAKPGQKITGKLMQDVPLPTGARLPQGAKLQGTIVAVSPASSAASGSRLTIKFDRLTTAGRSYPLIASLRALASTSEVFDAQLPTNSFADYGTSSADWNTIQVGGDAVYRGNGMVVSPYDEIVGTATIAGAVMAKLQAVPALGCRDGFGSSSKNGQPVWIFSASACGTYGFSDLKIEHAGRTQPVGEIELRSDGNVHVSGGSGWLLRMAPANANALNASESASAD